MLVDGAADEIDIRFDAGGNIVIVGNVFSSTSSHGFVAKLASDCSVIFQYAYEAPLHAVDVTSDGHYLVAGTLATGIVVLELDSADGSILAQRSFGTSANTVAPSARKLHDGSYFVTALKDNATWLLHTDSRMALSCTGAAGNVTRSASSLSFTDITVTGTDASVTAAPATFSVAVGTASPTTDCAAF